VLSPRIKIKKSTTRRAHNKKAYTTSQSPSLNQPKTLINMTFLAHITSTLSPAALAHSFCGPMATHSTVGAVYNFAKTESNILLLGLLAALLLTCFMGTSYDSSFQSSGQLFVSYFVILSFTFKSMCAVWQD